MTSFSVILPTYKRHDILPETLDRLAGQSMGAKNLEVIVIDDDADPKTEALALRYRDIFGALQYRGHKNAGQSVARNRAVSLSTAPLLFFTGDDILLEPDTLEEHARFHQSTPYLNTAVFGSIRIDPRVDSDPFVHWLNHGGPQNHFDELGPEGYIPASRIETAHLSIRREHALRVSFDESLRYYENAVWADALFQTGFLFYYLPTALSWHYHPVTPNAYAQRMEKIGETIALLEKRKNPLITDTVRKLKPVAPCRLARYRLLSRWTGNPDHQSKYWHLLLKQHLFDGYRKAAALSDKPT